ncbi:IST1 protein [Trifolium repens]|nr:IST1 protein [Trifolium repens]
MYLRNDLANLILNGHQDIALQRVEQLIQDESLIAAYELLDYFFEFILKQLSYIRKHKDCPTEINEAISSVIYASSRCRNFPELFPIRKLFAQRYGNDFVTAAVELLPGNLVNTKLKECLSVKFVSDDLKYRVVDEISKMISPSEIDQEIEEDVSALVDYDDDIEECEYFSSKDSCSQDQRLVLYNSSESEMSRDESSGESSIRSSYASRKRASKKRLRRRTSPLLGRQGIVEIGYTLHYQTPSPQSNYPKKRLKQHSNSDSCQSQLEDSERDSLDFNMSECSCNLDSPCYCSVYNEIEMFEYQGTSSSTNVFSPKTCDCLTTTPFLRALSTMPSKWLENYKDNLLTFSSPSQRPKHVHPKLPEYEEFVATFLALKREHAWS